MSFVQIYIHAVWGTKNRKPVLSRPVHDKVCQHIRENASLKDIFIDSINGHYDHLHSLMLLNASMSIAKQMQLIKGESSFWINKNKIMKRTFDWADKYFATSVSQDKIESVRLYIQNQWEHHKTITFEDEYEQFLKYFGFVPG
jgi:REP element-mobilizing transposase RayT